MRRKPVSKGRSARSYSKARGKTKGLNVRMPMRGGWRL